MPLFLFTWKQKIRCNGPTAASTTNPKQISLRSNKQNNEMSSLVYKEPIANIIFGAANNENFPTAANYSSNNFVDTPFGGETAGATMLATNFSISPGNIAQGEVWDESSTKEQIEYVAHFYIMPFMLFIGKNSITNRHDYCIYELVFLDTFVLLNRYSINPQTIAFQAEILHYFRRNSFFRSHQSIAKHCHANCFAPYWILVFEGLSNRRCAVNFFRHSLCDQTWKSSQPIFAKGNALSCPLGIATF